MPRCWCGPAFEIDYTWPVFQIRVCLHVFAYVRKGETRCRCNLLYCLWWCHSATFALWVMLGLQKQRHWSFVFKPSSSVLGVQRLTSGRFFTRSRGVSKTQQLTRNNFKWINNTTIITVQNVESTLPLGQHELLKMSFTVKTQNCDAM